MAEEEIIVQTIDEVANIDFAKETNNLINNQTNDLQGSIDSVSTQLENIENAELNFYEGDIFTLVSSLTSKYDLVYLSNIIDYANKKDYKNLLSKFNLNDNGVVLSYIFSHVKKYSDFLDMCEVKEDSKEDRGVLIYK